MYKIDMFRSVSVLRKDSSTTFSSQPIQNSASLLMNLNSLACRSRKSFHRPFVEKAEAISFPRSAALVCS